MNAKCIFLSKSFALQVCFVMVNFLHSIMQLEIYEIWSAELVFIGRYFKARYLNYTKFITLLLHDIMASL